MIIKEYCAENFENIPPAIVAGANRIELCDNLAVGGTSVSTGVMEEAIHYCHEKDIPVMTIIRPRGGNFVYNDIELKIMLTDLIEAKKLGTDGIVIGCLTEENWIDEEAMTLLLEQADGLQVTFHMAFDSIPHSRKFEAIDWLAERGVNRILTHGSNEANPIEENINYLKELIAYANNRITILPGGSITAQNYEKIARELEVKEVHGTKIVPI